jgi:N-acetylglucosamine-6-phosphate deacetylase
MIRLYGRLYAPDDRGLSLVTIANGRIASIERAPGAVRGARGGPEMAILPGLVDIQINGAFGYDFSDPTADMDRICRGLPGFGVTAFIPTIVTSAPAAYEAALANLRRRDAPGESRVLGVHLEGPFISPKCPGTHDPAQLRLPSIDEVAAWLHAGDVRIVTLAPELPGALELVRYLAAHGVLVSVGTATQPGTRLAPASRRASALPRTSSTRCVRSATATRASWGMSWPPT